jgi:hypothetical protein
MVPRTVCHTFTFFICPFDSQDFREITLKRQRIRDILERIKENDSSDDCAITDEAPETRKAETDKIDPKKTDSTKAEVEREGKLQDEDNCDRAEASENHGYAEENIYSTPPMEEDFDFLDAEWKLADVVCVENSTETEVPTLSQEQGDNLSFASDSEEDSEVKFNYAHLT